MQHGLEVKIRNRHERIDEKTDEEEFKLQEEKVEMKKRETKNEKEC